jgi:hypothetical protein
MAHDGQNLTKLNAPVILDDLLALTAAAVGPVDTILEKAKVSLRAMVSADGRVSADLIEQNQTAAHGLAWLATYAPTPSRQMQKWAEALESTESSARSSN